MIKLVIEKINDYHYDLKDKNDKIYQFNIEFHELERKPNEGDFIYMDESLLREEHSLLSFGPMQGSYGRVIESSNDRDLFILEVSNERIYLKRYYG